MLRNHVRLERIAAALSVPTAVLDLAMWRQLDRSELSQIAANRMLELAREGW